MHLCVHAVKNLYIVMTFGLSLSIMIAVTLLGFITFRLNYLSIFTPGVAPLMFLVLIETVSYVTQVISLGLQLAANISAGHLLFAILSGLLLICYRMVLSFPPC